MIQAKVDVLPDSQRGPGWAHLLVSAPVDDVQATGKATFSLQRNQDGRYLAEPGHWSAAEVWHHPEALSIEAEGLMLLIGSRLVDELLSDAKMALRLHLQVDGVRITGVLRFGKGLFPSTAAGVAPNASRNVVAATTVAEVDESLNPEPVSPANLPESEPNPASTVSPSKTMPILLGLAALAVLGAALAWFLGRSPTPTQPSASALTISQNQALNPCSVQALQATPNDLAFLQSCVGSKPNTVLIIEAIAAGKALKRCDLIQRLYAHQAQAGNVEIALAYAREFDPETFKGVCFERADPATAAYWYSVALQHQPDQEAVKQRIKALEAMK